MDFPTTIAACATGRGNAAIGVIRLSGRDAIALGDRLFFPQNQKPLSQTEQGKAVYGQIRQGERLLDVCLATPFFAPKSFTGEDTVEFSCHGGTVVLAMVLEALLENGAVMARPGEFSKRAFLNGKMDLAQAEAVIDLISAKSAKSAALASFDVCGGLSARIARLREPLLDAAAHIMAVIDYPDEDFDDLARASLQEALRRAKEEAEALLGTYPLGHAMKEGVLTAILGKPNTGKSSVMNLLAGFEKSIVTELAGTTRDVLDETVAVGDVLLRLQDTAGLRQTEDRAEQLGVARSKESAAGAELLLCVFDGSRPLEEEDRQLLALLGETPAVAVLNKSDLPQLLDPALLESRFFAIVPLCAKTGAGASRLREVLARACGLDGKQEDGGAIITNLRQRDCLKRAAEALGEALQTLERGFEADMAEIDLRNAIGALGEITGQNATEDLLTNLFSRFCLGK